MGISEKTESIVIATDGGSGSRAALRWAADHLGVRSAHVRVVTVADPTRPDAPAALDAAGLVLETITAQVTVDTDLLSGDPAHAIAEAARGASLLVVGARTGGGPLTSPRVPARVAALASCPVVIVPDDWSPGTGPIVVGSSYDSAAELAVEVAADLADRQGRALILVHAWEPPIVGDIPPTAGGTESIPERQREALDRIAAGVRAAHPGLQVSAEVRNGAAASSLAAVASTASLLVVGRRRRPAAARALLGSVSRDLVAEPPCAVMVIPSPPAGIRTMGDFPGDDL